MPRTDAGLDPATERVVTWGHQGMGASVQWAVETPTEVVVGIVVPAYCGGPAPPNEGFEIVLPASTKPARVQTCGTGSCSGQPLP
jgi:hypothetical protein